MLLDTNILIRTLQPHHPLYTIADAAIQKLPRQGVELVIVPQNLVELWAVATRPVVNNGLGLPAAAAVAELERLKGMFMLLPETATIYPTWERLVRQYQVVGKATHDARLVAAMLVHGVTSILTFDKPGFARYSGIQLVHPMDAVMV